MDLIRMYLCTAVCILGTGKTFSSSCQNSNLFYFNVDPKSLSVREGASAFLECNVSDSCDVQFHWTLDQVTLINTSRRYQNGSNLVIARVNKTLDSGEFHCIATVRSTGLSLQSKGAFLSVQWIADDVTVEILEIRNNPKTGEADLIRLKCNANGTEHLTVKWFLNGVRIFGKFHHSHQRFLISSLHRTLLIQKPEVTENGIYSCEAENSAGEARSRRNYLLAAQYPGLPKLLKSPEDVLVKEGDVAFFDCALESERIVKWKHFDNTLNLASSRRMNLLSNGTLVIKNVTEADEGIYECSDCSDTQCQAFGARLYLAYIDDFTARNLLPPSQVHYVGRGKRIEIDCTPPEALPKPKLYWTRGSRPVQEAGRIKAMEGRTLIINEVLTMDEGDFECVAENMAGKVDISTKLIITSAPKITFHPTSTIIEEGSSVQFECRFSGDPYPASFVHWRKAGELMASTQWPGLFANQSSISIFPHNGTLLIDHATLHDSGHYDCIIITRGFEEQPVYSLPAVLDVRQKLKFIPRPADRKFKLSSDEQIACRAVGHFKPTVRWFKQIESSSNDGLSLQLDLKNQFPPNVREKDGVLYFNNVRFENAGNYTCTASSGQGLINETIRIEVFVFPEIKAGPKNLTLPSGSTLLLDCIVHGIPAPKVEWFHDDLSEAEEHWKFDYVKFDNNTIKLNNLSHNQAGRFICMAGNKGGFSRSESFVCIRNFNEHSADCGPKLGFIAYDLLTPSSFAEKYEAVHDFSTFSSSSIALAVGLAISYLALILTLICFCGYRRRRQKLRSVNGPTSISSSVAFRRNGEFDKMDKTPEAQVSLLQSRAVSQRLNNGSSIKCDDIEMVGTYLCSVDDAVVASASFRCNDPVDDRRRISLVSSVATYAACRPKYQRADLRLVCALGSGRYGGVDLMRIVASRSVIDGDKVTPTTNASVDVDDTELSDRLASSTVVVKAFDNPGDSEACQALQGEIEMYSKSEHPNVIRLVGICLDEEPILVIYEYLDYGNLKHYLQASLNYEEGTTSSAYPPPLSLIQTNNIAHQVSKGMEYLTNLGFVHKDLAARNILLSSNHVAKVCHLSLSNDAFYDEYCHCFNPCFPLRWMSPELLFPAIDNSMMSCTIPFSEKSDVWAFAVFLWETLTIGQLPYFEIEDNLLIDSMKRQLVELPIPRQVPDRFRLLLKDCWNLNPKDRPSFAEIRQFFDSSVLECSI